MIKPTFLIIAGVMALALPSVRAGWSAERRPYYTVDHMCSAAGDKQSRACFTSDFDVSSASGNFNGHHSPDGRRFVIFGDEKHPAFLELKGYKINVVFQSDNCAMEDVQTTSGDVYDNMIFCNAAQSRVIHLRNA